MGCCIPIKDQDKEQEQETQMIYHYHNLNISEIDDIIQQSNVECYLCKQLILHRYEQITSCNLSKKVIGHTFCVLIYRDTYYTCPACYKSTSDYHPIQT
jgi:hypothetical protein